MNAEELEAEVERLRGVIERNRAAFGAWRDRALKAEAALEELRRTMPRREEDVLSNLLKGRFR